MNPINVTIVDDQPLVARAFETLLADRHAARPRDDERAERVLGYVRDRAQDLGGRFTSPLGDHESGGGLCPHRHEDVAENIVHFGSDPAAFAGPRRRQFLSWVIRTDRRRLAQRYAIASAAGRI